MRVGVIGGGVLGLTLAHRLATDGHSVTVVDSGDRLGGLATWEQYDEFVWDRFYHCVMPQDRALIALIESLGIDDPVRWTETSTGYYVDKQFWRMNTARDFMKFPGISFLDKLRVGGSMAWATRVASPRRLAAITAERWLTRMCGRRGFEKFWQPLLRAKFGPYADRVAATFLWATCRRLAASRAAMAGKDRIGYIAGGYRRVFDAFEARFAKLGGEVALSTPVSAIRQAEPGCVVESEKAERRWEFDQVFFTAPTGLARSLVDDRLRPYVDQMASQFPTSAAYLGVICLVLVTREPLTPFYILNIGDPSIRLTGLIEVTNLVDRHSETASRCVSYLPRYVDSDDPAFDLPDEVLIDELLRDGYDRLFDSRETILEARLHRARFVQPLPLAGQPLGDAKSVAPLSRPFHVINSSQLSLATLNNNEVVELVGRFLSRHRDALAATSPRSAQDAVNRGATAL